MFSPLLIGEECDGVLRAANTEPFSEENLKVLDAFANEIALILRNARLIRQLKEEDTKKSDLLQMVAHELRTPLTSLILNSEIMMTLDLTEEQREFVKQLKMSAERYGQIVKRLLSFCRIESDRLIISKKPFSISRLAEECIAVMNNFAEEKEVQIEYTPINPKLEVNADREMISEVITNLLENAIKFTPKGGNNIKVTVSEKEPEKIQVEIKDRGKGITRNLIQSIFNKYFQGNPDDADAIHGSGLGLTISKFIIEQHGGTIGVESTVGMGSRFYFTLPK
jgi:signal transduction histidine kinase